MEHGFVRKTPRCSLTVDVEITDAESKMQIRAQTKMLSMFGCGVESQQRFPKGTSVKIKLTHQGNEVSALARVVYSKSDLGMGFAFTALEHESERILDGWIVEYLSMPVRD